MAWWHRCSVCGEQDHQCDPDEHGIRNLKELVQDLWERSELQHYTADRDLRVGAETWYYSDPGDHEQAVQLIARVRAVLEDRAPDSAGASNERG